MKFIKIPQILQNIQLKRLFRAFLLFVALCALGLFLIDLSIRLYVRADIYENSEQLPHRPYGLVLGTSKYFVGNNLNLFYYNRMLAAQRLYQEGKVDYLLLSGDNRTAQYNEPRTMFNDLRKMGVPPELLYLDFAGFRTLDSVIRAKQVFNAVPMTIISQKFHCERALFIAKYYDIDAICFAADYPEVASFVLVREFFARLRVVLDLLLEKEPHFLGKPEPLPPPLTVPAENENNAAPVIEPIQELNESPSIGKQLSAQ